MAFAPLSFFARQPVQQNVTPAVTALNLLAFEGHVQGLTCTQLKGQKLHKSTAMSLWRNGDEVVLHLAKEDAGQLCS